MTYKSSGHFKLYDNFKRSIHKLTGEKQYIHTYDYILIYVYVLTIILYVSFDCRNMIKSFYTSSLLFDVLSVFGELSDEVRKLFFSFCTLSAA